MRKFLLALLIFIGVERFCYFQTDGFILSKMVLQNTPPPPGPSETLTFIGAGKQFYVFETSDHQHVIKFMKFSRRRPLPWLEKLPLFRNSRYLAQRAKRLYDIEYSSKLALQHLSSEAALASYQLPQNLILIDKLNIAHSVDTAQTKYIVQKKASPFTTYFNQNPPLAQTLISSYIKTVASQCKKGICNLDLIDRNYGVVDNQIILMDIGSLLANPKLHTQADIQQEIFFELLPLRQWLQNHHAHHIFYFDQALREIISSP